MTIRQSASQLLPLGLAFIAEAAWLAVLSGLFQGFARSEPLPGLPAMVALVAASAIVGRVAAPRLGGGWPPLAIGMMVAAPIAGLLLADDGRAILLAEGLAGAGRALEANPGVLLAALAVLRGTAYAAPGLSAERLERVLGGGTVVIVGAAVLGGLMPEPWRTGFTADTLLAGLVFAGVGIVALALRRQALEARDRGADWQRNPRWVLLLVIVVLGLTMLAAVSAGLVRPALEVLVAIGLVPLVVLGLIFGWTRRGVAVALGVGIVTGLIAFGLHLDTGLEPPGEGPRGVPPLPPEVAPGEVDPLLATFGGILALLVAIVLAYVLVRWWARLREPEHDPTEERFIQHPASGPGRPPRLGLLARLFRPRRPRDAVSAYRMLLSELDEREVVRRDPSETPREHAQRLRREGAGSLPLELLAADYGLAVFGATELSEREHRRAIGRWRSLRRSLQPPPLPPEP